MAVHAHPDDESSKGAATMARYASEGVDVLVVTCTGGGRGSLLHPRVDNDETVLADLPAARRREMAAAAEILGIDHHWLGFVDSGLPEGDPKPDLPEGSFALTPVEVGTEALVKVVREFRPHVMTTYNENGGYPHPDHLMTHAISMAAYEAPADPARFPDDGPPWEVSKIYYDVGFNKERIETVHQALIDRGVDSPFQDWLARAKERPSREVTTQVRCADF